jgi:HEAT repeat protein
LLRKIHDAQSLPDILPFFASDVPELRATAVTTLSYLNQVEKCPQALALISDTDLNVRRATALSLGHLTDPEVISILCQALKSDTDWQVRRNAAKSLAIHADCAAILALETAVSDEHWQVRKFALQALQKIPDERVMPALIRALADEYSDVRKEAAIALGNLSNPAAMPALQQSLDDPDKEVTIFSQKAIQKIQTLLQNSQNG